VFGSREAVELKRLHRYSVNGKRRSLRDVSSALAQAGFLTRTGRPFMAEAISRMVTARV
jgi:hypothetical protein